MLSPGYIHCAKHPDHGEPVTYAPGQELPDWVNELLGNGATLRPVLDETGSFDLVYPSGDSLSEPPCGIFDPTAQTIHSVNRQAVKKPPRKQVKK